jgi:hypothetical protein
MMVNDWIDRYHYFLKHNRGLDLLWTIEDLDRYYVSHNYINVGRERVRCEIGIYHQTIENFDKDLLKQKRLTIEDYNVTVEDIVVNLSLETVFVTLQKTTTIEHSLEAAQAKTDLTKEEVLVKINNLIAAGRDPRAGKKNFFQRLFA